MGKATLSLSTNAFPPDRLMDCLSFAAARGLAGVEVGPWHAESLAKSAVRMREAAAAFKRLGIRPLSVHSFKACDVKGLPGMCAFAVKLGAGLVVVHCRHEQIVKDFKIQAAMLAQWDAWCRERGIVLTVENSSIQPLREFVRLFDAVPALRLTLDVKHAYKPEKLGLTHEDYLSALGGRVANFHISGIDRSRDELGDGCPPGRDHVNWRSLARNLTARGYEGLVTMEVILPIYLTAEEQERAYFDLPPASDALPTISHRLAEQATQFYRKALKGCLRTARK
jgi:sugar phosphate isomerase/epimerase